TPIHWAAWMGHLDLLKYFNTITNDKELNVPNEKGITPLMGAIKGLYLDIIEFLLSKGVGLKLPNVPQDTDSKKVVYTALLIEAIKSGDLTLVSFCINKGINVNINNVGHYSVSSDYYDDFLKLAIYRCVKNRPEILDALLDAGLKSLINKQDRNGNTCFM